MTAHDRSVSQKQDCGEKKKEKAELRKRILRERNALPSEQRRTWDRQIFEKLVKYDTENPGSVYLCYVNYKSEVSTKDFICWCMDNGKTVFVPKVSETETAEMEFYRINAWKELKTGYQGISEPDALPERAFSRWITEMERDGRMSSADGFSERTAETGKKTPIVRILLPGAVFDKKGNRIGYGGGFYDRWLAKQEKERWRFDGKLEKIGISYKMQIVEAIETERFDQKVDYIMSEEGLQLCSLSG